jgi:AcrR family transcriptional regulator
LERLNAVGEPKYRGGRSRPLSLNAIAKQMRMSGPAVYRYFASRDGLLKQLVVMPTATWATRSVKLEEARRRRSEARFRAVANAYRGRALDHPGHYPASSRRWPGRSDQPPEIAIASQRATEHILAALHDLDPGGAGDAMTVPRELDAQPRSWAHDRGAGDDLPPWMLRLAIVTWQRLHGHIGLELEGVHAAMGISSDALYRTEVDAIIAEARGRWPGQPF